MKYLLILPFLIGCTLNKEEISLRAKTLIRFTKQCEKISLTKKEIKIIIDVNGYEGDFICGMKQKNAIYFFTETDLNAIDKLALIKGK